MDRISKNENRQHDMKVEKMFFTLLMCHTMREVVNFARDNQLPMTASHDLTGSTLFS